MKIINAGVVIIILSLYIKRQLTWYITLSCCRNQLLLYRTHHLPVEIKIEMRLHKILKPDREQP
jgi:hypothetical protein